MITDTITVTVLRASKDHYLTNGEIYGKEIYLAPNQSKDDFHEITDAKYNKIMEEFDTPPES